MSEREEKLLKLLEKLSNPDEKFGEDELISLLTKTYTLCRVPPLQDPNVPYSTSDFDGVASEAENNLSILLKLLNYIAFSKNRHDQQFSHVFQKSFIVTCLLAACEYCDESWEWSSPAAASVSKKIMDLLCKLHDCNTMQEFFANSRDLDGRQSCCSKQIPLVNESRPDILKATLQKLIDGWNKDNWKQYPSLKMSYSWILMNIGVSCVHVLWYGKEQFIGQFVVCSVRHFVCMMRMNEGGFVEILGE